MNVLVGKKEVRDFSVTVPSSKSFLHRALITACLCDGVSVLKGCTFNADTLATLEALRKLGAKIDVHGRDVSVDGSGFLKDCGEVVLDCKESGSTLRFLIPLATFVEEGVTFVGSDVLLKRPLGVYQELFDACGVRFELKDASLFVKGKMKKRFYEVEGSVSSQFITGLIYRCVCSHEDCLIEVVGTFASYDYVCMTVDVLRRFGFDVTMYHNVIAIRSKNVESFTIEIEQDVSSASFFAVYAAMNQVCGEFVGITSSTKQGDFVIFGLLEAMGCKVYEDSCMHVCGGKLKSCRIDLQDCIDLGPILFALAACIEEGVWFEHTGRLRVKESDRIQAMQEGLLKLGCTVLVEEDRVFIQGKNVLEGGVTLDGFNDHRIVMAFAILSSRCKKANTIVGWEACRKSYPTFFEDLEKIGMEVVYVS